MAELVPGTLEHAAEMQKPLRQRINERHPDGPYWRVTVATVDNPDFTVVVPSPDEWKARTTAMLLYPHQLNGNHGVPVGYTVIEVVADPFALTELDDGWKPAVS